MATLGSFFPNIVRRIPLYHVRISQGSARAVLVTNNYNRETMHALNAVGGQITFSAMDSLAACASSSVPGLLGTMTANIVYHRPFTGGHADISAHVTTITSRHVCAVSSMHQQERLLASATFIFARDPVSCERIDAIERRPLVTHALTPFHAAEKMEQYE